MTPTNRISGSRSRLPVFFALSYAISWSLWALPVIQSLGRQTSVVAWPLVYVGAAGPCLAALMMAFRDRDLLPGLWRSATTARLPLAWYAASLALMPALMVLSHGICSISGEGALSPTLPLHPIVLFIVCGAIFLQAGIGEEIGWRGYALPRLVARRSPASASLVIGLVWGVWHLPLFAITGTVQYQLASLQGIILFLAFTILWSVIISWIYIHSNGSLLLAMAQHTATNVASVFLQPMRSAASLLVLIGTMTLVVFAIVLVDRSMRRCPT
jgi:membrane protease YdiL (CAAX protease family)